MGREGIQRQFEERVAGSSITRGDFLRLGGLGVGATILMGLGVRWRYAQGEGRAGNTLIGEPMDGGELVDEQEMVALFNEAITRPVTMAENSYTPTIFTSILYHTMIYLGVDTTTAQRRAKNLTVYSIKDDGDACGGGVACVVNSNKGLGEQVETRFFEATLGPLGWVMAVGAMMHEGGHGAVRMVDDWPEDIDLWVQKIRSTKGRRGFYYAQGVDDGPFQVLWKIAEMKDTGVHAAVNLPEEFAAQYLGGGYWGYAVEMGLKTVGDPTYPNIGAYQFMVQGLVDAADTVGMPGYISWREWWGDAMSFKRVRDTHYQGRFRDFLQGIGEKMIERNLAQAKSDLRGNQLAGLGAVALGSFLMRTADEESPCSQIFKDLRHNPLNPDTLSLAASRLAMVMATPQG